MMTKHNQIKDIEVGDDQATSAMSKLVKALIKVCFIPVKTESTTASFSYGKLFVYFLITLGSLLLMLSLFIFKFGTLNFLFTDQSFIDVTSYMVNMSVGFYMPLYPILLGLSMLAVPNLSLDGNLKWPKYGGKLVVSYFCLFCGGSIVAVAFNPRLMEMFEDSAKFLNIFPLFIITEFYHLQLCCCWTIPTLLVASWISKFNELCQDKPMLDVLK
jgi:hypothetical protein